MVAISFLSLTYSMNAHHCTLLHTRQLPCFLWNGLSNLLHWTKRTRGQCPSLNGSVSLLLSCPYPSFFFSHAEHLLYEIQPVRCAKQNLRRSQKPNLDFIYRDKLARFNFSICSTDARHILTSMILFCFLNQMQLMVHVIYPPAISKSLVHVPAGICWFFAAKLYCP